MPYTHNLIFLCPCGNNKVRRERAGPYHQAVITRGLKGIGQAGENTLVIMEHGGRLAVHQPPVSLDDGAKRVADALMPQAHAQDRQAGGKLLKNGIAYAGLKRRAGAGRNNDFRD